MSTEALPSAAVSLEEIVAKNPTTALYLPLAERLLSRGLVAEAIRLCEERQNRPAKGVGDFVVLGRCYLADGRLAEARAQFEGALGLDRENVIALKSLAGILSHEGHHADAADLYRAVCRVDPGDLESQTALHQITSGDFPEVRPPEVIVSQGNTTWQPVRVSREEDHLPELALGLRTLGPVESGPTATTPRAPAAPPAAAASSPAAPPSAPPAPSDPPAALRPEPPREAREPLFAPDELSVGPSFPKEPRAAQPAAPAGGPAAAPPPSISKDVFQESLSGIDVGAFQESALERLESAFRPAEAPPLGEAVPPAAEAPAAEAPAAEVPAAEARAAEASAPGAPTEAAKPEAAAVAPPPKPAAAKPVAPPPAPAPPAPAAPLSPAERSKVEGNRSAFERWLGRIGGDD